MECENAVFAAKRSIADQVDWVRCDEFAPFWHRERNKASWGLASDRCHGLQRPDDTQYFHDPLQVVGKARSGSSPGTHAFERPGQEVGGPHPVLQRPEHMPDCTSADRHCIGPPVKPALHGFQRVLMFPSSNTTIIAC
jgi:hypothetical protein